MISLINKSRQIQTFNLTRELAPIRKVFERRVDGDDGGFTRREHRVVLPDSITLLVGGRHDNLHPRVVHAPEIAAAIKKKLVEVVEMASPVVEPVAEASADVEVAVEASPVVEDARPTAPKSRAR